MAAQKTNDPKTTMITITRDNACVRFGDSTDYEVIAHVQKKQKFAYIGKSDRTGWIAIAMPKTIGWIAPGSVRFE